MAGGYHEPLKSIFLSRTSHGVSVEVSLDKKRIGAFRGSVCVGEVAACDRGMQVIPVFLMTILPAYGYGVGTRV